MSHTRPRPVPALARWTLLLTAAEAVGMTAAATTSKAATVLVGEPSTGSEVALTVGLVVAGGLVEGIALGSAQALGLGEWLPRLRRRTWVLTTVLVAGLGWAGASLPAQLAGRDDGGQAGPPLLLVVAGGAVLGAAMGALLGGAQALVLRRHVRRPRRWVTANVLAWTPAMAVIMLSASTAPADWSVAQVAGLGAVTGATAGAVVGQVTGRFLPRLEPVDASSSREDEARTARGGAG